MSSLERGGGDGDHHRPGEPTRRRWSTSRSAPRVPAAPSPTSTGRSSSSARSTTTGSLALDRARELVTQYLGQQPHIMKASGVAPELLEEIGAVLTWPATAEQIEKAMHLVPDEVVQLITALGDRRRVPRQGARVRRARLSLPGAVPTRGRRPRHDRRFCPRGRF